MNLGSPITVNKALTLDYGGRGPTDPVEDLQGIRQMIATPSTMEIFSRRFDPITMILAGRRGRGKTASLTFFGAYLGAQYEQKGLPVSIAANYNTEVATEGLTHPFIIDEINSYPAWAVDLLVLIDEASAYFIRRRALARVNVDFSTFLQQIRKRSIEMIFTTQFPGMLDDQMLINIDLYVMCNMWPRSGWNAGRYVDLYAWDWHGQFTGNFVKPTVPPQGKPFLHKRLLNVNRMFSKFNTNEVIGAVWSDSRESIAAQYWDREVEDQPGPSPMLVAPTSLAQYLLTLGVSFIPGRHLADAKGFDDTINTIGDFEQRIKDTEMFDLIMDGRTRIAVLRLRD